MTQLYFRQIPVGQMQNFAYLIGDKDTHECVVVDPAWDIWAILNTAAADGMKITGALATHYHPDHIGGNIFGLHIEGLPTLMALNPCKCHAHKLEASGIQKVTGLSQSDLVLHDSGDTVKVGGIEIELLHTPGHTPGSMCFRLKDALVSGDTLFLTGCGRVDLPGGDPKQMQETLTQRLSSLPDSMILYPGHAYGGDHAPLGVARANLIQNF
jgi:glyoxylase-like metal-dependent hydrolase (beta-lactamase superfamily II)